MAVRLADRTGSALRLSDLPRGKGLTRQGAEVHRVFRQLFGHGPVHLRVDFGGPAGRPHGQQAARRSRMSRLMNRSKWRMPRLRQARWTMAGIREIDPASLRVATSSAIDRRSTPRKSVT